jgi:hypothetical protein
MTLTGEVSTLCYWSGSSNPNPCRLRAGVMTAFSLTSHRSNLSRIDASDLLGSGLVSVFAPKARITNISRMLAVNSESIALTLPQLVHHLIDRENLPRAARGLQAPESQI